MHQPVYGDKAPLHADDSSLDYFLERHGKPWLDFARAYTVPAPPNRLESHDRWQRREQGRRQDDPVTATFGKLPPVYQASHSPDDLKLLLELAFTSEGIEAFLTRHLAQPDGGLKAPITEGRIASGNRVPSAWLRDAAYKKLLERLESACTALNNHCVFWEKSDKARNIPMLHAVEKALVEKWMAFRNGEVIAHPAMEGRPLSDATHSRLGVDVQEALRNEILQTTQGQCIYRVLWKLFMSSASSSVVPAIHPFKRKVDQSTLQKLTNEEAVAELLSAYHTLFDSTLFTYDSSRDAMLSTLLRENLKLGLLHHAFKRYTRSIAFTPGSAQIILRTRSLDEVGDPSRRKSSTLGDTIAASEEAPVAEHPVVPWSVLTTREREVLEYRYGLVGDHGPLNLTQISEILGVTRQCVQQAEVRALSKLTRSASALKPAACEMVVAFSQAFNGKAASFRDVLMFFSPRENGKSSLLSEEVLTGEEYEILTAYHGGPPYSEPQTARQIADDKNLTTAGVSRIRKRAEAKLIAAFPIFENPTLANVDQQATIEMKDPGQHQR